MTALARRMAAGLASLALAACATPRHQAEWNSSTDFARRMAQFIGAEASGECRTRNLQAMEPARVRAEADRWQPQDIAADPASSPPRPQDGWTAAKYPEALLSTGHEGGVLILAKIEADGSVVWAEAVCATHPGFIDSAKDNVKGHRFHPARVAEKAVRSTAYVPVVFGL